MAAVVIRVGAAADRSLETVMNPLIQAMARARGRVQADSAGMTATAAREAAKATAAKVKQVAAEEAAIAKGIAKVKAMEESAATASARADAKAFDQKLKNAQKLQAAREAYIKTVQREVAAEERAQAMARNAGVRMQAQRGREAGRNAGGIARDAYSTAVGLGRAGLRVGGQIARGMGVDFDIGSNLATAMDLQRRATNLSNSAFQNGALGAAGIRQDPRALISEARTIGNATGFAAGDILGGQEQFTKKTGDLATAREITKELAVLAKASGTELDDMVSAAGDVGLALGDVPDKGAKIVQVMKSIAGQGKLGAVEISDLASQMAKVAANAPQFEGDVASNIVSLGALTQLARQKGGAATPQSASQSALSFANTLKTPQRVAAFEKEGISVYNSQGMMRDPFALVRESIQKAGSTPLRLKDMWKNVAGAKGVEALASDYRQAGGGAAGMAAVDAQIAKLKNAAMGEGEILESFTRRMADGDTKVQLFNNKMTEVAERVVPRFLVVMEKLAPSIEAAAETFAGWAAAAAENPGTAILAAITASIAQAAIGQAVGTAITAAIARNAALAGALSIATAAVSIAAATIAVYKLGTAGIDAVSGVVSKGQNRVGDTEAAAANAVSRMRAAGRLPENDPERIAAQKELQAAKDQLQKQLDLAKGPDVGLMDVVGGDKDWSSPKEQVAARQSMKGLEETMARVLAALEGGLRVKGNVSVDNMPTNMSGPTVDPSSRVPQ